MPPHLSIKENSTVVIVVSKGPMMDARRNVVMPDVRGRTIGHAVDRIERRGVTVQVSLEYSSKVPANRVTAQYPQPGEAVPAGSIVVVQVSRGHGHPPTDRDMPLPNLTGKHYTHAEDIVSRMNLVPLVVETYHPTVPAGDVIAELPNPDSVRRIPNMLFVRLRPLLIGMAFFVAFVVIGGYFFGPGVVPDVRGMQIGDAARVLQRSGYYIESVDDTATPNAPTGQVLAQIPAYGAPKRRGTGVVLVVDNGTPSVMVPDLTGLTTLNTELALSAVGLAQVHASLPSVTVAKGLVIAQNPAPGVQVVRGTTVTVTYSSGLPRK